MRFIASKHNDRANQLKDAGQVAEAIAAYQKAIEADPSWSAPWYNLGLLYKYQSAWEESLRCNQRAVELNPKDEGAWWNLGIAATALQNWVEARRAWQTYGIKIPAGDGPIEMQLGPTPIRLNPDEESEVVWCDRIDPARAVIQSIPLSDSGHRYGDIVLHDGAPNGYRKFDDQEVPVFDALELWQPSAFGTFVITLDNVTDTEMESLEQLFDAHDLVSEEWSTSIQLLCRACSEGRPFSDEHQHDPIQLDNRHLAVAAMSGDQLHTILQQWQETVSDVIVVEVSCELEPLPTA
jgi:hypothetical protein